MHLGRVGVPRQVSGHQGRRPWAGPGAGVGGGRGCRLRAAVNPAAAVPRGGPAGGARVEGPSTGSPALTRSASRIESFAFAETARTGASQANRTHAVCTRFRRGAPVECPNCKSANVEQFSWSLMTQNDENAEKLWWSTHRNLAHLSLFGGCAARCHLGRSVRDAFSVLRIEKGRRRFMAELQF